MLPSFRRLVPLCLLPLVAFSNGDALHAQGGGGVPLYDNLGTHHYTISTSVPRAQQYFDQGLRLYYAFNHGEAIRAFNEAARLDPRCAICYWGTALAYGPNINLPMDSASGVAAWDALGEAMARREHATAKERALIEALSRRYSAVPVAERAPLDSAYARALQQVVARYPQDPEVRTLYAEALMTLSPWQYWNRDGSPRPDTPELLAQLEAVLETHPDHPGANHFFIHAVEAVDPQRAVPMAERLAGLMPGAGHLVHMPGHIYVRVGRYLDAIRANEHAVHADETYIQDHNPAFGIYTLGYYPHNYDFLAFAASMIGRSRQAIEATDKMATLVPEELLREPGLTLLQNHMTRGLQMRVRFGLWDDILTATEAPTATAPEPAPDLPYAHGIWHYARARALAASGQVDRADAELAQLRAAAAHPGLEGAALEFNPATALLAIATDVLAAYIAEARGDHAQAVTLLRSAASREDDLVYGEPPEWSVPVRHDLGAVLLRAGRPEEAEAVYREDLQRFPENGWSLHGLAASLTAQGRTDEAEAVRRRFAEIWKTADVRIPGSN
jgi:tetratricopeptide (TPR) repeat protein